MKIQEVISELSNVVINLSDIKMKMVGQKITDTEAKQRCAIMLERVLKSKTILKAIEEWGT